MHSEPRHDTQALIDRACHGEQSAAVELLAIYRPRLHNLVAAHLNERMARRVDASDIVQEALLAASQRLPEYFRRAPYPFYAWLRQIAWDRLHDANRRHIDAERRSVHREDPLGLSSAAIDDLMTETTDPGGQVLKAEQRERIRALLARLSESEREVLIMKYLENLTNPECAAVLGVSVAAVKKRHVRAILHFRELVDHDAMNPASEFRPPSGGDESPQD